MAKRGRKRKMETEDKVVYEWEKDRIFPENLRDEMETMWELPQIYHFLQLTKDAFNITHLSMYEVERMLLMPEASRQLAQIMTCLLSNPSTSKSKLHKIPLMPYTFWTNVLMYKLKNWFKIYQAKRNNPLKTFDSLGVEPEFWNIFPNADKIEGKDFQDFSFKQRVWLLKTICDTATHSRKTIQEEILKQPPESQFETVLGMDRYGARYIYFPQFLHNDLRVYKQSLDNKVLSTVKRPVVEVKPKIEEIESNDAPKPVVSRGRRKKRRSRWSKGSLPLKVHKKPGKTKTDNVQSLDHSVVDSSSNSTDTGRTSRCSSKASEFSAGSCAKSSGYETNVLDDTLDCKSEKDASIVKDTNDLDNVLKVEEDVSLSNEENKTEDAMAVDKVSESLEDKSLDKSVNDSPKTEDSSVKDNSNIIAVDDVSKSSKTDDEKLEEINATKTCEKSESDVNSFSNLCSMKDISKSDDEKLSESQKCDSPTDAASDCGSDDMSLDKWMKEKLDSKDNKHEENSENEASDSMIQQTSSSRRSARIKYISEIKLEAEDAENIVDMCETEEMSSIELRDSLCRVSSPEENFYNDNFNENGWKVDNFNELISDLSVSNFQLVADSLDSLKDLIEYIASDKTVLNYENKEVLETPICEVNLLKRMRKLTASLDNVQDILKESTKKARNKLQREWNNFENGVMDEDQEQHQDGDVDDGTSTNRWLIGPQGCNYEKLVNAEQCTEMLSHSTLSRDDTKIDTLDTSKGQDESHSDIASATAASGKAHQTIEAREEEEEFKNENDEAAVKQERCEQAEDEEVEKSEGAEGDDREKEKGKEAEEPEPRQTRRVLRARGVSSYTEQFSDDESEEEQLDEWADTETSYTPAGSSANTSAVDSGSTSIQRQAVESYDDESQEDSDQDWILPGSRKRKRKRSSASRRLKTFQNRIQNIQEHNASNEYNQQLPQQPPRQLPQQLPIGKIAIPRYPNNRRYNHQISYRRRQVPIPPPSAAAIPVAEGTVKTEPQDPNLHSVLDIKDEGPIYDSSSLNQSNATANVPPNYVVVTTGQAPVANYYVMQQNPTAVVQQSQYIQSAAFVPQMQQMQSIQSQGYYVHSANPAQNYVVQNPSGIITAAPRPTYIASTAPVVYQQQTSGPQLISNQPNYVQYVSAPVNSQPRLGHPKIINSTTISPPRQIAYRGKAPMYRMPGPLNVGQRPSFPHPPNGAVIRSAPITSNVLRPGQRAPPPQKQVRLPAPGSKKPVIPVKSNKSNASRAQKDTSLIVLSDSDDEIEMIIPAGSPSKPRSKPTASPQAPKKSVIPPELLERMNEGGISLSPIKPAQQPAVQQPSNSTQLVVVVNETGSHYALALPNGSKLILTPEQVAQIRASNGGKLVL